MELSLILMVLKS